MCVCIYIYIYIYIYIETYNCTVFDFCLVTANQLTVLTKLICF